MQLLEFTLWELVALLGLVQSVWLCVYMLLRAGRLKEIWIALLYFTFMAFGFLADFGTRYLSDLQAYPLFQDMLWYSLPVLSLLLSLQIARPEGLPAARYLLILMFLPVAAFAGWVLGSFGDGCNFQVLCDVEHRRSALGIVFAVVGAISLLLVWLRKDLVLDAPKEKLYRSDRYWLVLALIMMNCALIFLMLSFVSRLLTVSDFLIIRDLLGCGLVYVASTSLFRIYPQAIRLVPKAVPIYTQDDALIKRLNDLLSLQKVYQEPSYSRADLARELGTSEAVVTGLVKAQFGKSVPQLLNERRVADAMLLLKETTAPVAMISQQAGFNSVASFNRVFKEAQAVTPTEYRERYGAKDSK